MTRFRGGGRRVPKTPPDQETNLPDEPPHTSTQPTGTTAATSKRPTSPEGEVHQNQKPRTPTSPLNDPNPASQTLYDPAQDPASLTLHGNPAHNPASQT